MQWPAVGDLGHLKPVTNNSVSSQSSALLTEMDRFKGKGGNNWTHALIMLHFRRYPLVSHFNNPPQLDVLVPSARQCLVIQPGWKPCWGLTFSTLMESTMRDTHPVLLFPHSFLLLSLSPSQMVPPWVLRLAKAGVRNTRGWGDSHLDLLL